MSVLAVSDRTQETAQNIGASTPITLLGVAGIGLQAFPARLDGELVPYTIEHETSGQWEVGEGVYNHSAKTLARTIVYDNSNGNTSPVNFANGIVDVWIDLPAEKAVMLDADSSNLTVPGNLTMQAGATMALAGATVSGAPTWSAPQPITLATAVQPNVTTMAALISVGTITTGAWNATPVTTPYGGTGLTTYAAGDTLYYVSGTTLARRAIGAVNTVSLSNGTNPTWAANLPYATLPTGNGTWDNGSGNTVTFAQNVTVSGTLTASGTFIGSAAAGSLTGTTLASNVVTSSLTSIGTLVAGAVPASLVTAGTFGGASYTFTNGVTFNAGATIASAQTLAMAGAIVSGAFTASGTVGFTNASPFSLTNGQVLTVATTAQTTGAATLTIPNFASASDTFAFLTLAQTLSNKTLASPTVTGTLTLTGATVAGAPTWSSGQTFPSATQVSSASGAAFLINGAAGQTRDLQFESAGSLRWVFRTNATAESGGNAGSDFNLIAHDDTGAQIDAPISILRVAGGVMTLVRPLRVSNTIGVNTAPVTTVGINNTPLLQAAANNDVITGIVTAPTYTPGAFSGIAVRGLSIGGIDASGFTTPGDVTGIAFGNMTGQATGNTYQIRFGNGSGGATNYLMAATMVSTFNVLTTGIARFTGIGIGTTGSANVALVTGGTFTASGAVVRGIYQDATLVAAANSDSLLAAQITPLFTPGALTGLKTRGLQIDGWSTAAFTTPSDPIMLDLGNSTGLTGTGAANAYALKFGAGPSGATNNYLIHATNFNLTSAGLLTSTGLQSSGAVLSSSATAGSGYSTGAGGAVTQLTSRTTAVTVNKACGAITLFAAAGSVTPTTFTVNNSLVAATDLIDLCVKSSTNVYFASVTAVGSGTFNITFYTTGGITSDSPVITFAITKAVTS